MGQDVVRAAVVQRPPVLLDRDETIKIAVDAVSEVGSAGAGLAVFPETFVPGYPVWIWGLRPQADYDTTSEIHRTLQTKRESHSSQSNVNKSYDTVILAG